MFRRPLDSGAMTEDSKMSVMAQWRKKYKGLYDAVALVVYTSIVYGWALTVHPLGRDYALMAGGWKDAPAPTALLLRWELAAFSTPVGYHLVNLVLLYATMLLIYKLTAYVIRGPWWLGTLAATLYMATPVHSESVLNLMGAVDLVPTLFALVALVAYGHTAYFPAAWKQVVTFILMALAVYFFPENTFVALVPLLFEGLALDPERRRLGRAVPCAALVVMGLLVHGSAYLSRSLAPEHLWAPLYFLLYPIGFLPESAQRFHAQPWSAWLAAATVAFVFLLIYRKARRPAILFGLFAMLAVRLFPSDRPVDPVHLVGGGQLLLANVFFLIGLVALFYRMMDHPRWRTTIIGFTTLLCVIFFILQMRSNLAWKRGGEYVAAFQRQAVAAEAEGGALPGLLPDYRYYLTAPLMLSESIRYDTPFNRAVSHVGLLPLNRPRLDRTPVLVREWAAETGILELTRDDFLQALVWPYTLVGYAVDVEVLPGDDKGWVRLKLTPKPGERLPSRLLPLPDPQVSR